MERGKLYRYARAAGKRALRRPADRLDGVPVSLEIALGVARGARALAEHVEGVAIAPAVRLSGARKRILDCLAKHELVP